MAVRVALQPSLEHAIHGIAVIDVVEGMLYCVELVVHGGHPSTDPGGFACCMIGQWGYVVLVCIYCLVADSCPVRWMVFFWFVYSLCHL